MGFFSKTIKDVPEAPPVDRRRRMRSVPVLNDNVSKSTREDGNTTVAVHLKRGRGLLSRLQPPKFTRTYKLDELGSFVLHQIDGQRTVQDIVYVFVREYKVNQREAELCVTQFLKMLLSRLVISVIVP